jgi:phosphodiesterase/alkaline phosphatase D-like protein
MAANIDVDVPVTEGEVFYVCGVASPYKWANNAHLAVKVKAGAKCELALYTGDKIYVDGAEKIPFDDKKTLEKYGHLDKSFTTCRNFQFGVYYFE